MAGATRYSIIATALHWAMALLILGQIAGGIYMHNLPNASAIKFDLYQLHKSIGLSVLALTVVRLAWRFMHAPPALPRGMPYWQKLAARGIHWLFYVLLLATPLAGLAIVSVSPKDIPTEWFGLVPVPHLGFLDPGADPSATEHGFAEVHEILSFTILGLLVLHVAAALKHGILDRDGVLRSMALNTGATIVMILIFAGLGVGTMAYFFTKAAPDAVIEPLSVNVEEAPTNAASIGDHELNASTCIGGAAVNWKVRADESKLRFIGERNGLPFEGGFGAFNAEISFNADNLEKSWIRVVVETGSAATGDELIDSTIPGGDWFNAKDHPVAIFEACDLRPAEGGAYEAHGTLTIKEIEQDIILPFSLTADGETATATGGVDLIRTSFELGADSYWLNDEGVALKARVEFELTADRGD